MLHPPPDLYLITRRPRPERGQQTDNNFSLLLFNRVQTQNTVYEIVSEMNTRQDVLEDRLGTLEEKLNLLQETLEALPEAISRYLPALMQQQMNQQQQQQQQQTSAQAAAAESGGTELQRRQQFLHPESSYGSMGGSGGGVSHSRFARA